MIFNTLNISIHVLKLHYYIVITIIFLNYISHVIKVAYGCYQGFPGGSSSKESSCNAGDGFNSWVREIPGERNGNPLQYSCLENSMDRGVWPATIHGVSKSWT